VRSRSLLWSFDYAIQGIVYTLRTQRNMRIHSVAAIVVLVSALVAGVGRLEMIALLFAIGFVLVTELTNTAIEAAVDLHVDRFDPHAKIAKDVAAGAVLVSSVVALGVGYMVFHERMAAVVDQGLLLAKRSPVHLTLIALGLTALLVVGVKAMTRADSFMRGGWPSGHTALAASAATTIAYLTQSAAAAVLALFIAALVAQSRVESEAHTLPQVGLGALLGVLVTTAVFQVFFL